MRQSVSLSRGAARWLCHLFPPPERSVEHSQSLSAGAGRLGQRQRTFAPLVVAEAGGSTLLESVAAGLQGAMRRQQGRSGGVQKPEKDKKKRATYNPHAP